VVGILEAQRHHIIPKNGINEPDVFEIQAELCRAIGSPLRMK